MSTRANIVVTFNDKTIKQYYHHCDGYPEYMGVLLYSFIETCGFIQLSTRCVDALFETLLKMEGHFEDEGEERNVHGDIEYLWFVDLVNYELTYTHRNYGEDVKHLNEANEGETVFRMKYTEER